MPYMPGDASAVANNIDKVRKVRKSILKQTGATGRMAELRTIVDFPKLEEK